MMGGLRGDSTIGTPNEVIPGLYIGSYQDALDIGRLRYLGVTAVLNVADLQPNPSEETYERFLPDIVYDGYPIYDDPGFPIGDYFVRASNFIHEAQLLNEPILVHCVAGISRSATIVAAYLMRRYGWCATNALRRIKSVRPWIQPNDGFLRALGRWQRAMPAFPAKKSRRRRVV